MSPKMIFGEHPPLGGLTRDIRVDDKHYLLNLLNSQSIGLANEHDPANEAELERIERIALWIRSGL